MKNIVRSNRPPVAIDQFIRQSLRAARIRARIGKGALTFGLALSIGAGTAIAEEAPAAGEVQLLEEIVVTAQFRQQNLQTTPVAITAVNAQQLDDRNMSSLADLNALAPNLTITKGTNTNGPAAQTFIRGIGQSDGHPGLEPGVGIYVDDVYHGLLLGSDLDLTDLDRVEVLRGPQGTLAGKNSIGGSIKLFSKKPSEETDGYVDATYGDFNRVDIKAGSNFTIVPDTLYARVSGVSKEQDGYMKRLDYACATGTGFGTTQVAVHPGCQIGTEGGEDIHAVRVALRWIVSDKVENNFIASTTQDRSEVPALKLISSNNTQGLIPGGTNGSQFVTGPTSYTTYATFNQLGFTDPAKYNGQPGAGTHGAISLPTTDPINNYGLTDTVDWKVADHYTLTAITGYLRYKGAYSIEVGDSPFAVQVLDDTWADRQFTEEVRLNGTSFERLDWTVGGYYFHELANFGGLKMLSPGLSSETLFTGNDPITSSNKSGFAHGVWHATDALSVITGVRYTKEDKAYTFQRLNPYDQTVASYTPVGPLNNTTGTYAGNHTDYRVGIEYQWTESIMTYAQYSTGFRGGGVNPRPFVPQQEVPFGPETLRGSEIGLKSDLLDHHLRLNVAAFYNQYKNILLTNTAPTIIGGTLISANNQTPVNVGAADIEGAEAEFEIRPISGLQFDGSLSYLNFKFTSINTSAATIPGVSLDTHDPYAPDRMASLGAQYTFVMGTGGSLVPRFDADYQSSFYTDLTNTALGQVSGRTLLNARLTWKAPKDDWQTSLAVTNLGDKFYYVNKVNAVAPTNIVQGQPGAPREWLVSVRRNF
jgi:iron complex outermembrane recepter protein